MISIGTNNLAFRIGDKEIISEVSFSLEEGDRLAVVGVNGSGKSTLLKMLSGDLVPDEGEVFVAKGKSIGILHQDDAFNIIKPENTSERIDDTVMGQMYAVFEELCSMEDRLDLIQKKMDEADSSDIELMTRLSSEYESVNNSYVSGGGLYFRSRCSSILTSLGFGEEYFKRPVTTLSGGQRTRLALARLLFRAPDILILDEPTNHLDIETMEWLEDHLMSYGKNKTVIVVSHDRFFLDKISNKTLDIENKRARLYKVKYSEYVEEKKKYIKELEKKYDLQQKEIARLEAYIEQQRRWGREKNIIAAESREKAIARMVKIEKPKAPPKSIRFTLSSSGASGNDVLSVKGLTMGYGNGILFKDLGFLVKKNDRLFITGPNGSGKSTLIKLLIGSLEPIKGSIEFGYNVTVGYYDQENQNLTEENTVLDELWNSYPGLGQMEIRNTLALFMFRGDDIEKKVSVLSGGERARLTLAKLILSKMNLLILDEPTNHLDVESREALENALRQFDGTVIAVSHDRYFTKQLATRFVNIGENGLEFSGTYDEYTAFMNRRKSSQPVSAGQNRETGPNEYEERKKTNADKRKAEKRKAEVLREISKLEKEIVDIDDLLFGEAATDYIRAAELSDRKITVEDRLYSLYEEEEKLEAELSEWAK